MLSHGELVLATFVFSVGSGFMPVLNVEAYLVLVAAASSPVLTAPLVLAATAGQMVAKSAIYLAGRGLISLPLGRYAEKVDAVGLRIRSARLGPAPFVGLSSLTGFPPFYATSVAAGVLRVPFVAVFFLPGTAGRILRFGLVALFPHLVKGLIP